MYYISLSAEVKTKSLRLFITPLLLFLFLLYCHLPPFLTNTPKKLICLIGLSSATGGWGCKAHLVKCLSNQTSNFQRASNTYQLLWISQYYHSYLKQF